MINPCMRLSDKVVFLNRAYNDLDMQVSVIVALAELGYSDIHVVGIIADGHVSEPYTHELSGFLARKYGVQFSRVTELYGCPWPLKMTSLWLSKIRAYRKGSQLLDVLLKPLDLVVRTALRFCFKGIDSWVDLVVEHLSEGIVITDEIVFQEGRSPVIDRLAEKALSKTIPIYVIKTGHHIYKVANPAKVDVSSIKLRDVPVRFFNVSGPIDEALVNRDILRSVPVRRFGNPRMNAKWVNQLSDIVPSGGERPIPRVPGVLHVSIMLSKINYGVDLELLKECIITLATIDNVELAIKPHTRGMKFDFMDVRHLPRVHVVSGIPSTELIEWSDLVLFSGSSVAFHALLKGKVAGYLAFLQEYETIFDRGNSAIVLNSVADLEDLISGMSGDCSTEPCRVTEKFFLHEVHGGSDDTDVAGRIASAIIEDLSLLASQQRSDP